jgi:hypothetical protein
MKPDLYTKVVLTVIAVALIFLCIEKSPIVHANTADKTPPQEVIIVGVRTHQVLPVGVAFMNRNNGAYQPVSAETPLPVATQK